MLMLTSKFENIDFSTLGYEDAKKLMIEKAKSIDPLSFYHRLMNCGGESKIYHGYLKKRRKEKFELETGKK